MNPKLNNTLNNILLSILGSEEHVELWWYSKNKAFDNISPNEMIIKDEKRVVSYLLGQLNGDYS